MGWLLRNWRRYSEDVHHLRLRVVKALAFAAAIPVGLAAQDRLRIAPGYERAQRLSQEAASSVRGGALSVKWTNGTTFEYLRDAKRFR